MQGVKTTTFVCNRFNTFCTKDHKTDLAMSCYTLLHQAQRGEGKNSLRKRRDILVSDRDQQQQSMMCYPPTDYIMISFKEVKIL